MKFKKLIIIMGVIIALLGVIFYLVSIFIKNDKQNIQKKKKMYCYQTYWKVVNPALYVEDEKNIDSLVKYYHQVENGNQHAYFNFPPLLVPLDTCVYILGYSRDRTIAKIVCYYKRYNRSQKIQGYVYIHTLHDIPPKLKPHENN